MEPFEIFLARMHLDVSYGLLCQETDGNITRLLNYYLKAIDHKFLWFRGVINHLGCC